jgi:DNA polymerase III gamma/tau subunit
MERPPQALEEPPPQVVFIFATTEYREYPAHTSCRAASTSSSRRWRRRVLLEHLKKVAAGEA